VQATVRCGDEAVVVRDQLLVRQKPDWDQFHILAYTGYEDGHPATDTQLATLRSMGTTPSWAATPSRCGCGWGRRSAAAWCPVDGPTGFDTARCGSGSTGSSGSAGLYEMQDEPSCRPRRAASAVRLPADMTRFRQALRGRYGTSRC